MEKDIFGFADAVEIELINEDNLRIVELIFKDFKQITACRLDKIKLARKRAGLSTGLRELSTTP